MFDKGLKAGKYEGYVLGYFLVRHTHDSQPGLTQELRSFHVVIATFVVYAAVDLDDNTFGMTVEVDNETSNNLLAAKLEPLKLMCRRCCQSACSADVIFLRKWRATSPLPGW